MTSLTISETKVFNWVIEDETEHRGYTKWQLRPLAGWPNGVDPYPNLDDEDIAMVVSGPQKLKLEADFVGDSPPIGFAFDVEGKRFVVTGAWVTWPKSRGTLSAAYHAPILTSSK